jgi:hypothetical protein
MQKHNNLLTLFLAVVLAGFPSPAAAKKKDKAPAAEGEITGGVLTVLWREPKNISAENLFYGSGGKRHEPHGPFTFIKEDLDGSNPKFSVEDANGVKWKVKLGDEARPETVTSRLVWAVGYQTEWYYFMPSIQVKEMPLRLHRGQELVGPSGNVANVRLKREPDGEKKIGIWKWRDNPFGGTRELDGLRVLMAVVNNWDLKDENNAVVEEKLPGGGAERFYEITDLGSSFGKNGLSRDRRVSKGDLEVYIRSKFIKKIRTDTVDFETPRRPDLVGVVNPREFVSRLHLRWIGRNIPREDARWMGSELAQLSPEQIRDAFRAAGYSSQEVDGFATVVEARIAQLNKL